MSEDLGENTDYKFGDAPIDYLIVVFIIGFWAAVGYLVWWLL